MWEILKSLIGPLMSGGLGGLVSGGLSKIGGYIMPLIQRLLGVNSESNPVLENIPGIKEITAMPQPESFGSALWSGGLPGVASHAMNKLGSYFKS